MAAVVCTKALRCIWLYFSDNSPPSARSLVESLPGMPQHNRIELLQGTLDMLILQTLQWGPQHGHGISVFIRTSSNETLQVDTGSLYPALHRLERQKWISSEWKVSENNQRVKAYRLTSAGKKHLAAERSRWERLTEAVEGVLNPARKESEA